MRVFTAGVWDLFHYGHLRLLERSKELGDELIVGVSTDDLVERYKKHKPLMPLKERLAIVGALKCVDIALIQMEILDIELLTICNPDIITLGNDWEDKMLLGAEWFKKHGGKIIYLPYTEGISTSNLTEKIRKEWG